MGDSSPDPVKTYAALMEDVKSRVAAVHPFAAGQKTRGSVQLDHEFVCLQLRKILEAIAFGSRCANKGAYAAVHSGFAQHWKAKDLLAKLEEIHPSFYPEAVRIDDPSLRANAKVLRPLTGGFLTRNLKNSKTSAAKCCTRRIPLGQTGRQITFRLSIAQWIERIQRLLSLHYLVLAGSPERWVVVMEDPGNSGKVTMVIAWVRCPVHGEEYALQMGHHVTKERRKR